MDLLHFVCFVAVHSWMVVDCVEHIRLPPSIVRGPLSSILFRADDVVDLPCSASGVPAPVYEWKKNGVPLNLNGRNVQRQSHGDIKMSSVSSLDEGFYQCVASNQYGITHSNVSVVRRAYLDSTGSTYVFNKTVKEGEPLKIEFEQVRSHPKPQNRWASTDNVGTSESTSTDLTRSKRMQWDENGNLYFSYVLTEDHLGGRIYKGVSYNPRVDVSVGGSYTRVEVQRVPGGIKPSSPHISFSSKAQTIGLERENITLRCFFAGYPNPDITWTGPRKVPSVRYVLENYNTELKIFDLKQSHEGEYTCTGSNSNGTLVHRIMLTVQAVPVFNDSFPGPRNVNATERDNVTFQCNPYAKPKANITWMINGEPLDVAHRLSRMLVSHDGHELTIRSVCRDCSDRESTRSGSDLMVIQCNASNEHGYAFAAGYLNVLKKTTVILESDREVVINKDNPQKAAVFKCSSFSDPSTPVSLSWYRMDDDSRYHIMHSRPSVVIVRNNTLTINAGNDTSEWVKHEGRYKCVAYNGYSKAEAIVEIRVDVDQVTLASTASILDLWWIFLVIACLLFFLILILVCYICIFCNRGDKYDVDGKERKNGNDPEKELVQSGFHDYQRREIEPFKGSQNLLGSSTRLFGDDASEAGDHGNKFLENGSYRSMSYTDTGDRKKGRSEYI